MYDALPPELYEVLNGSISTMAIMLLAICARYLATEYQNIVGLFRLKLAVGTTVLMVGESTRMSWLWLARYLENTHRDTSWMGGLPWVLVPIAGSVVAITGIACMIRALVPMAWGRWAWCGALTLSAAVNLVTLFAWR